MWSCTTWCCSFYGRSSCEHEMSTTAHWGRSCWCLFTTWTSVRSALLTPAIRWGHKQQWWITLVTSSRHWRAQNPVLPVCYMFFFSFVVLLCCATVHLVFRRLHPWEVCGWQTSQRAARFPGWSKKRTRASARVTDMGFEFTHRVVHLYEMDVLILREFLSIPGTCPWSCATLLLAIPWSWV